MRQHFPLVTDGRLRECCLPVITPNSLDEALEVGDGHGRFALLFELVLQVAARRLHATPLTASMLP